MRQVTPTPLPRTRRERRASGRRMWRSFASSGSPGALLDELLDAPVDARRVLLQSLHLEVPEADQLEPRGGSDRGAAHRIIEHPCLAEDVALSEVGDVIAIAGHLRGAILDREQLAREAALLEDHLALGDLLRLREGRDLLELLVGSIREEGDALQLP